MEVSFSFQFVAAHEALSVRESAHAPDRLIAFAGGVGRAEEEGGRTSWSGTEEEEEEEAEEEEDVSNGPYMSL